MTAKYQFKNDYVKMLKILRMSKTIKVKNGWSRNVGAGFICEDIEDLNLTYKVRDSLHKNLIIVKTPAMTMKVYPDELNLRETEEAVKWLEKKVLTVQIDALGWGEQ